MQKQITQSEVEQATIDFMIAKQDKDVVDARFKDAKKAYYSLMDRAFESGMYGDAASIEFEDQLDTDDGVKSFLVKATRTIPTKVEWDIASLRKALSKKLPRAAIREVIKRERQLFDLPGLVEYMRMLGGDPKVFWSFFTTNEYVDKEELDQLSELGEIDEDDIAGCYSISVQSSRYRVTSKEVDYDENGNIK